MKYIEGRTLRRYLDDVRVAQAEKGLSAEHPGELLELFRKICDAVHAAHKLDIVHRDLKPSNIILDEKGKPYVLDFGLARSTLLGGDCTFTTTGVFLGTLRWSSPEQIDGKPEKIDQRSDVYTLGVMLYNMLTAEFPYETEGSLHEVLDNILHADPTPPSDQMNRTLAKAAKQAQHLRGKNPINKEMEAIILKALRKRPIDRYQHAGEFERDIACYLAGKPSVAGAEKVRIVRRNPLRRKTVTARAGSDTRALRKRNEPDDDTVLDPSHTQLMTTVQKIEALKSLPKLQPEQELAFLMGTAIPEAKSEGDSPALDESESTGKL
jgi:serine/threonine protein kinase